MPNVFWGIPNNRYIIFQGEGIAYLRIRFHGIGIVAVETHAGIAIGAHILCGMLLIVIVISITIQIVMVEAAAVVFVR